MEETTGTTAQFGARFFSEGNKVCLDLTTDRSHYISKIDAFESDSNDHHGWWHGYVGGHHIEFPAPKKDLRIADLFCGPGGLSLGVSMAARALGLRVRHQLAVDIDREALRVCSANHRPKLSLHDSTASLVSYSLTERGDVVDFGAEPIVRDERIEALRGQVDLMIAGPPCQGHSTANSKRRMFDPRNLLYLTVPALAVSLEVPHLIIENVPGVQASQQGVVQHTWKILESRGYRVNGAVINASEIGWAQNRRRYFLVASREYEPLDLKKQVVKALAAPPMAISDLLSDLVDAPDDHFMTALPDLSKENLERIHLLHSNDWYDLPDQFRNKRAQEVGTSYRAVYGRMHWDRPAQTITTGFMTPGRGRYVHPLRERTLIPREAARLQGFPDSYIFDAYGQEPARTALAKWIGDAVPAPLGFAAALAVLAPGA